MNVNKKLIRAEFREEVFTRDNHTCVIPWCDKHAQDAHHIIERALWLDPSELGGYLLDNGASLCEKHHIHAEKNYFPPEALREWCGIQNRVIPKQLSLENIYNKWGKILKVPNRGSWENIKYPHTPYLDFSFGFDPEDIRKIGFITTEKLIEKPLIVTIKMDGSNATLVKEGVAARNASTAPHKSFDMLKSIHSKKCYLIPKEIQVFGEWLFAKHSIHYTGNIALDSYFQVFAVYNREKNMWLSWDAVEMWAKRLNFPTVPVIERIQEDNPHVLQAILTDLGKNLVKKGHEGFVVRSRYPFHYGQFRDNVCKFVRPNHVTTDKHWSKQEIVKNELII